MATAPRSRVRSVAAAAVRLGACLGMALGLGLLPSSPAAAQETNATLELARTGVSVDRETERGEAQFPFYLSRQDCIENATFRFALKVTGLTSTNGRSLQMWVSDPGVDCKDDNVRAQNTQCGLVAVQENPNDLRQFTIEAEAQDIVRAFLDKDSSPVANGDSTVCDERVESDVVFQFFIVQGTSVRSNVATWEDTQIDLVGPDAPINVTAGIGEEKLIIEWDVADGEEDSTTESFAFYCDVSGPPPTGGGGAAAAGGASAGLAGAAGNAGTPSTGSGTGGDDGTATCPPGRLQPGEPPTDLSLKCGSVRGVATRSGKAKPLENFTRYAVAVAAVDQVGNSGPLSNVACETPEPVISFYEAYRNAGGEGGGGYCALGAVPAPGALGAFLLAGVTFVARRRRRRE